MRFFRTVYVSKILLHLFLGILNPFWKVAAEERWRERQGGDDMQQTETTVPTNTGETLVRLVTVIF